METFDIASVRAELDLSQAELAEGLGLHQTTISRMERGDLPMDKRTLMALTVLVGQAREKAA